MSARIGAYQFISAAGKILGSAAGATFAFTTGSYGVLAVIKFIYVATATAGSRFPVVRVVDVNSNFLLETIPSGSVIPANQTSRLYYASGVTPAFAGNVLATFLPVNLTVPPSFQINIFDNNVVDVNDNVTPSLVMAM